MDTGAIINKLNKEITDKSDVCSSGGSVFSFPEIMKEGLINSGIGVIVCLKGSFSFSVSSDNYTANEGETVFIPEGKLFRVISESDDMELKIILYRVETIKNVIGNMAYSIHLYHRMSPDVNCVWKTGYERMLSDYISLIGADVPDKDDFFAVNEHKLLILSLTYRLCQIFQKKLLSEETEGTRSTEIFLKLINIIDKYYMSERGVEFYAGKLFLSPKYLSAVSKSVSGYTVQELVFKAIVRKSMSLLDGTNKTVQEISEELGFPNPSSFGTFFRKHVGTSPQKYRTRRSTGWD